MKYFILKTNNEMPYKDLLKVARGFNKKAYNFFSETDYKGARCFAFKEAGKLARKVANAVGGEIIEVDV